MPGSTHDWGPAGGGGATANLSGVYGFRDEGGSVLYLGRAATLRRRVRSYRTEQGDRPWLARMVPCVTRVEVAACDSTHEAAWLEGNLLERRRPGWNRAVGGNEVPVAIRVDNGEGAQESASSTSRRRPTAPATSVRTSAAAVAIIASSTVTTDDPGGVPCNWRKGGPFSLADLV